MNVFDAIPQPAAQTRNLPDAKAAETSDILPRREPAETGGRTEERRDPPPEKPSEDVVSAAVSRLNDYIQNVQRSLRFSVDEATGRTVITVLDAETDEVVRQVPPERLLAMMQEIAGANEEPGLKGLLVRETV